MANTTPKGASASASPQDLRVAINNMDCFAQGGFKEIAAIARLALKSLETPEGYRSLDNIAHALEAICEKADMTGDSINWEAEQAGADYVDEARRRRFDAAYAARAAREQGE